MKLLSFDPNTIYLFRTLDELNAVSGIINESKSILSTSLQYCLQKYRNVLDIPRLCRALAIPGELAENFIKAGKSECLIFIYTYLKSLLFIYYKISITVIYNHTTFLKIIV